jgi:Flp pilus assembly protein TadG
VEQQQRREQRAAFRRFWRRCLLAAAVAFALGMWLGGCAPQPPTDPEGLAYGRCAAYATVNAPAIYGTPDWKFQSGLEVVTWEWNFGDGYTMDVIFDGSGAACGVAVVGP